MNRPIDPDLDDRPRVSAMSREQLERGLVSMAREFAEERTENRKLKKLLVAYQTPPGEHALQGCAACDRGDYQLGHADHCPKSQDTDPEI